MKAKLAKKRLEDLTTRINDGMEKVNEAETKLESEVQNAILTAKEIQDKRFYSIKCTFFSFVSMFAYNNNVLLSINFS